MNSKDNKNFSDFLHEQYEEVKDSLSRSVDPESDKYGELQLIGEGAQKTVYKVYDHSSSREVAFAIAKNLRTKL